MFLKAVHKSIEQYGEGTAEAHVIAQSFIGVMPPAIGLSIALKGKASLQKQSTTDVITENEFNLPPSTYKIEGFEECYGDVFVWLSDVAKETESKHYGIAVSRLNVANDSELNT